MKRSSSKLSIAGVAIVCFLGSTACADMTLFDMEWGDPVTWQWIAGTPGVGGPGTQSHEVSSAQKHSGDFSLKWRYTFPTPVGDIWPVIEMTCGTGLNDWTGATGLGTWMYFDLTGAKTDWTIEPVITNPYPTITGLGNWNSGADGVPNNTWTQHVWSLSGVSPLAPVDHIRWQYHTGDGWQPISKSNNVDIYLDDIFLAGLPPGPPTTTTLVLWDMEGPDPATNPRVAPPASGGTVSTAISTAHAITGNSSLLWRYQLPENPVNDTWILITLPTPTGKTDWTGSLGLSAWMYFDLTGAKTYWTIQPHPWNGATRYDMGNWNAGGGGVPAGQWIRHLWDYSQAAGLDLANVTATDWDYHLGDGWIPLIKAGNIDLYLDDIGLYGLGGPAGIGPEWALY
ncbi:MAG: hypothetical protein NTY46_14630 [Candidatus Sumerlaeota bacterium]|nr:hypothetical protein [Candidatus Sumerlaeota bacterium]